MTASIANHQVVSEQEWLQARKALLAEEKAFTRQRDEIARKRRELPWAKVEKNYVFDGPNGKQSLASLFGSRSQLIVYHFMFGPEWAEGCPSCSFNMDHMDGSLVRLAQRDVAFAAISRATISKLEAFKKRMGWRFNWVSSYSTDFNRDYKVSFTKEELAEGNCYNFGTSGFIGEEAPGLSVFYKDPNGEIFHTYSGYARGLDILINTYNYLDFAPRGRDEENLYFPMAWLHHHDRYESGALADADRPYWPSEAQVADAKLQAAAGKTDSAHACCAAEKSA